MLYTVRTDRIDVLIFITGIQVYGSIEALLKHGIWIRLSVYHRSLL